MKLSLEVLTEGKQKGKLLPITLTQFLIGRDAQCHLRPASPLISKRHCAVILRDDKVFVRDFDSTNGTFVNDQPVKGEVQLTNEDHLKVGPIEFTVRVDASAALNRPTPPPPTKAAGTNGQQPAPTKAADETKVPGKTPAPTKKPPTKPVPAPASGGNDDDNVAAMLMSMQDDTESALSGGEVPEGSTVLDLKMPSGGMEEEKARMDEKAKSEAEKEKEKAKMHQGNTASAAKSILEKMMRRPRT